MRPFEGGSDLRFGRVKNFGPPANEEVIFSITSDIGKQYQLSQTLLGPLTNDRGNSLSPQNLTLYAIRGSNKQGTISVEEEVPVSLARMILYTSSPQGLSDSFHLVYLIKDGFRLPSGSYRGRIAFTLEPIGAAIEPVTVVLNIFAEIQAESGVEIKTATGSNIVNLNTLRDEGRSRDCLVEIKGGMGSLFRIIQQLQEPLRSQEGEVLPMAAVTFQISEAKKGSGPLEAAPLSTRPDVIYTSSASGEADTFVLTYRLAEDEGQKAGLYRSNLGYFLDSGFVHDALGTFGLEVEIARKFDLSVRPETGGTIEFRNLKVQEPPKQSEVLVEVKSNIGRQYQVSQELVSGLVDKEGRAIPAKYFTLKEEKIDTKGTLPYLSGPAQVKIGDMILFVSDRDGSSDRFKVVYQLSPSFDIPAGDYSARFMYSISEI